MYIGMALAAILCIAIGVYPALLYNHLPFAVDYHPYTAPHVIEALQYLFFTALGFWLLIKMLGGEATLTMDTDWFYRRPVRLVYSLFVAFPNRIFVAAGDAALGLARAVTELGANPAGYVVRLGRAVSGTFSGTRREEPEPAEFDPDRYRISVGVMLFTAMLFFVILFSWAFFWS
jgi:multicomponent Na+:H+ antiporter subunit D